MSLLNKVFQNDAQRHAEVERSLIRREAKIGGRLFGPVPAGSSRQFFRLDGHTWVWHEEWTAKDGQHHAVTTRYSVRPNGVLKTQDGRTYHQLSRAEARNLYKAVELYGKYVGEEYQRLLQTA